ncbi:MAG: HEAT repeat domain-containing protein [Alphaproteobacteria bacterium]|nr:HEAT repeat domain-containing protein [Alphaproteobacteria bacterium]
MSQGKTGTARPDPVLPRRATGSRATDRLAALVDPLTARIRGPELADLAPRIPLDPPDGAVAALVQVMSELRTTRAAVDARASTLRAQALEASNTTRQALVVRHLRATVQDARALRRDLGAAARGMLDISCLLEREGAAAEDAGARLELCARLAPALVALREAHAGPASVLESLDRDQLQTTLAAVARGEPRRPTRLAAVHALAELLAAHGHTPTLSPGGLRTLQGLVRDPDEDPWVRRAAVRVVRGLGPDLATRWLQPTLTDPDALVRSEAVATWLARRDLDPLPAVQAALQDESELVRFLAIDTLAARDDRDGQNGLRLLRARGDARQRARVAFSLGRQPGHGLAGLARDLKTEADPLACDPLVLRTLLDAVLERFRAGEDRDPPETLRDALDSLQEPLSVPIRRRLWLLRAWLDAAESPARAAAAELARLPDGEGLELRLPAGTTALDLARALVPHAAEHHGFQIDPQGAPDAPGITVRVVRGDPEAPAAWRVLDELRQPAPAKRQGHTHASGRADRGRIRVPPQGTAEAVQTGVPGQRVMLSREEGWAPEVPMADDLLHSLRHPELIIVTPAGTTRVTPPDGFSARWQARSWLTWRFRQVDRLRHDGLDSDDPDLAREWARLLGRLGFRVRIEPADAERPPPDRSAGAWLDPLAFAVTMGASTLTHLTVLVFLLGGVLFGRLAWARQRLRRARRELPLVMGGWGTRGKSGTERLKAGLLEALGLPFAAKTTGCEAMLLHAPPGGRARELFLYRPYDKATIWEQAEVAILAPRLGARVLLWECMALNPKYVDLLQQRWMRDDVSTLTNAFPDHEDIQGPTGRDVATVIGGFSPPGRTLFTAEEGMLPVLRTEAERRGATLHPVRRAEHELLPRDLLARFRHAEHPANVALVARLAGALGVPWVEAVGWMAERVVADVGALVIHAPAHTEGRTVVFSQGMSANDPLSFQHNWRTAGFGDPPAPGELRITVVNNRADRVARSRMFAGLLADRAAAHRHVLIGTNLSGLRSYLLEAVRARLERTDLAQQDQVARLFAHLRIEHPGPLGAACARALGAPDSAAAAWEAACAEVGPASAATMDAGRVAARAIRGPADLLARSLPEATRVHGDELVTWLVDAMARYLAVQAALASGSPGDRARLYETLVDASLVVVEDAKSTGDETIHRALQAAPPGATVQLMGLQNIKGTGLDFAYRWVEWGELHPQLVALQEAHERGDGAAVRDRLGRLGTRAYGSVLACESTLHVLAGLPDDPDLRAARTAIEAARDGLLRARGRSGDGGGLLSVLVDVVERFLDPFHAVWRRREARRILDALAAMRISHERADKQLKALVDSQKGGWLRGKG